MVRWEAATVVLLGTVLGLGVATATVHAARLVTGSSAVAAQLPPPWLGAIVAVAAAVTLAASALAASALAASALPAARAARAPIPAAARK